MKRVVTIQDFSCVGRCSLTAALPVISAAGVECCAIPTAVLSNHTGFSSFYSRDLTEEIAPISDMLARLGIAFDALYTGYMASSAQMEIICGFIERFAGGMFAGLAYTFVRKATGKGVKGYYVVFFFSAFSTLAALPLTIAQFSPMTAAQLLSLVGAGLSAAGGQFSITAAYTFAPAKEVSIYDYSQIGFAALLGFVFMRQIPDGWSFLGYGIIFAAALAMFIYNNRPRTDKEKQ